MGIPHFIIVVRGAFRKMAFREFLFLAFVCGSVLAHHDYDHDDHDYDHDDHDHDHDLVDEIDDDDDDTGGERESQHRWEARHKKSTQTSHGNMMYGLGHDDKPMGYDHDSNSYSLDRTRPERSYGSRPVKKLSWISSSKKLWISNEGQAPPGWS